MSKRYAVVNDQGYIVNVIIWDGITQWSPAQGQYVIRHENCDIGDRWDTESKELIKVCRLQGCEDKSHGSQEEQNKVIYTAHEDYRLPEHKE